MTWRRAIAGLAAGIEAVVVLVLFADVALTVANTVLRYLAHRDLPWAPEVSLSLISIIAFLGAPAYFRRTRSMAYTALLERTRGRARRGLEAAGLWIVVAVCLISLVAYPEFLASQMRQSMPVLGLHRGYVTIWLGAGLVLLALFALERLVATQADGALLGLVAVGAIAALALALRHLYAVGLDIDPFWAIVPVLAAAFLVGTPVPVILALGGALYFVTTGDAPLSVIPASFQYGIASFILLAIPFFMLAGTLMEVSGMAARLVDMVQQWVGHLTGGLLIAEVVATYIFSGISGSKAADMATIGAVMKGPVRERGYPASEFAAVLCASAAMSETVPPSLAMLILGSVTSLSISALFVAGLVPALVLALALIVGVSVRSRRHGWSGAAAFSLKRALLAVPGAVPALGVPVIVIGGIVGGFASPTESGSLAVAYGLGAAALAARSIGAASFYATVRDAALTSGMVLLMVAAANVLAQAVVVDGLGAAISTSLVQAGGRTEFLLLSMVALIVIGFLLEGFPAILIGAPLFLPAAELAGVDPLQFGILLIMATGIGVMMPPFGIGFHIACAISGAPMNPAMRASAFYNLFLVVGLAIVVMLPGLTLWLPHAIGLH